MATKKARLTLFLPHSDIDQFSHVAGGACLTAAKFAAMIVTKFGRLKPEFALEALTSIPKEYFRPGPGRPRTATEHGPEAIVTEKTG
jgi:hypothetical protein